LLETFLRNLLGREKFKMNDMKLIMEGWRQYSNIRNEELVIESIDKFEKQILKELSRVERLDEGKIEDFAKGTIDKALNYVKGLTSKANSLTTAVYVRAMNMLDRVIKRVKSLAKRYPALKPVIITLVSVGLLLVSTAAQASEVEVDLSIIPSWLEGLDLSEVGQSADYIESYLETAKEIAGEDGIISADDWENATSAQRSTIESGASEFSEIIDQFKEADVSGADTEISGPVEMEGKVYSAEMVEIFKDIRKSSEMRGRAFDDYQNVYNRMTSQKGPEAGWWKETMTDLMPPPESIGRTTDVARDAVQALEKSEYGDMDRTKLVVKLLNNMADTQDAWQGVVDNARDNSIEFNQWMDSLLAAGDYMGAERIIDKF
tara:strand:+ start:2438 stop:3565 length:1128 start_codon:yes stop_codon:yes gene_type:complete